MEALETQLTSLGSNKAVLLPDEVLAPLGLQEGSRITLILTDGEIILRPVHSLQHDQPLLTNSIDGLCGLFASDRDLVAEHQQERRVEELQSERKRLSCSKAKTLRNELSSMHAGQPSLEDEYFRNRDKDDKDQEEQPLLTDSFSGLRGLFASDRDLVAELQQERRQDKW